MNASVSGGSSPERCRAARLLRRLVARRATSPLLLRYPQILRASLAVVVALSLSVQAVSVVSHDGGPWAWVSLALSAVGFALGYRWRVAGLLVVAAAPVLAALSRTDPTGVWTIAVFTVLLACFEGVPALPAAVLVAGCDLFAVGYYQGTIVIDRPGALIAAFSAIVAAAIGGSLHTQARYWTQLEASRVAAIAGRDAEVRRSVAEERLRITRDLHDGVGHEIAVLNMHLGAAEVTLRTDPDRATQHLVAARGTVRTLLEETQQIVRLLRSGAAGDSGSPAPAHGTVPALVSSMRQAGLPVEATLEGLDRPLSPQTSVAVHRIVQELLTNAQRHGAGLVTLLVRVGDSTVRIGAANLVSPVPRTGPSGGHGLVGMRERAEAAGGTLTLLSRSPTFEVEVELPVLG